MRFPRHDAIDVRGLAFNPSSSTLSTSGVTASGTLTVKEGAQTQSFTLVGSYTVSNFSATSDGHGGTLITDPPVTSGGSVATNTEISSGGGRTPDFASTPPLQWLENAVDSVASDLEGAQGGRRLRAIAEPDRRLVFYGLGINAVRPDVGSSKFTALGYGAEDLGALRARMTPEMLSYYSEEMAKNSSRGVVNHLSDVKLLQGDVAEAWREGDDDYATVAMRYSMVDRTLDRASGRMVEGATSPQESTELWTFRRTRGGHWVLSAVQQA
jgi:Tim44-like domain